MGKTSQATRIRKQDTVQEAELLRDYSKKKKKYFQGRVAKVLHLGIILRARKHGTNFRDIEKAKLSNFDNLILGGE